MLNNKMGMFQEYDITTVKVNIIKIERGKKSFPNQN